MIFKSLVVGPIQANCYLLGCEATQQALVIDPGEEPERIGAELSAAGLTPCAYFHTHGHLDHVGATGRLKQALGGEILLHRDDAFLYDRAPEQALTYGLSLPPMVPVDRYIAAGETVTWGEAQGLVLPTPGHSPGGICLLVKSQDEGPDWVFTGDTLFNGSIGRTDLPGGSLETLMDSIRTQLLVLPDETVVASGHGPLSTIGREKEINPFLQSGSLY